MLFPAVPTPAITGEDLPAARNMAPAVGVETRPLGPAKWNNVSAQDFCRAARAEGFEVSGALLHNLKGAARHEIAVDSSSIRETLARCKLLGHSHSPLYYPECAGEGRVLAEEFSVSLDERA